ncbi:MAG TPA: DUF1499 domain-containing protein [Patescibacteria group bacterium]|nr:DUF1499 domain-containing protein [Patescibacteria group bacterium]
MGFNKNPPAGRDKTTNGLQPCPPFDNCVCSQFPEQKKYFIEPIFFKNSPGEAKGLLKKVLSGHGARILMESDDYIHAEYKVALGIFKDDVEFLLKNGVIHVRSASRLGRSDLGVNRRRVEKIRCDFAALIR